MADSEVPKMKVADLKRELKLRGLSTTGNKNDLQERLQTALIEGDLSLEDTAMSGEDLLDDEVLTDEEKDILSVPDEKDLLKSPTDEKDVALEISPPRKLSTETGEVTQSKRIVLKRKSSITSSTTDSAISTSTTKENTAPTAEKILKMSERNPITALESESKPSTEDAEKAAKLTKLTNQERLELRAKKFGIEEKSADTAPSSTTANVSSSTDSSSGVKDEKQIEALKKRAERFGCVVSSTMVNMKEAERLQKRKERFGLSAESAPTTTTPSASSDAYAEKAKLRLERFKTTAK